MIWAAALAIAACTGSPDPKPGPKASRAALADPSQVAHWSNDDLQTFLQGSMCTECIPERLLWAFEETYPDLYPGGDLRAYGAIGRGPRTIPVGFSRAKPEFMGGLDSWGINCASCHVSEVRERPQDPAMLILGSAAAFNVRDFFGAAAVAMLRTQEWPNLEKFLYVWVRQGEPDSQRDAQIDLGRRLTQQRDAIAAVLLDDPFASKGVGAREMHSINAAKLDLTGEMLARGDDLTPMIRELLKVFHNVRASLGIPDVLPPNTETVPGPGRTDAFGVLAKGLLGVTPPAAAPVKYGIIWELDRRAWVHWDGNNDNVVARNIAAALGLGTPAAQFMHIEHIQRQTDLTQTIRAPKYPFAIDRALAARGEPHYQARCASCHEGPQDDSKLYDPREIGTDINRNLGVNQAVVDGFNAWLRSQKIAGYTDTRDWVRLTGKYWASTMDGVWARAPYLHNGSVRTMADLLSPSRPASWRRGSTVYDQAPMGFVDVGDFTFDTTQPGNSAAGHAYGTDLTADQKRELIEYLKTR